MKKHILILISSVAFLHCGGSTTTFTPLKKPVAITLSNSTVSFQGQSVQFGYIVDQFTQTLVPVDTRRERLVDTAPNDDFDYSPLPVGGEPSAIAVDDEPEQHRVFVADQLNNQIIAYEIAQNLTGKVATYTPLSLGGVKEGKSSRFLFRNRGALSSPTVTNVVVDPNTAKNESWKLTYKKDSHYEMEGTKSGIQSNLVKEGETYTTDNGDIQFFISSSGERTTNGDEFFFGSYVTRPLQLASSPIDLLVQDRELFILTKNPASIIVFDLDALSIDNTFPLPDAAALPTKMYFHDDKIYVNNRFSGDVFVFDILAQTYTTVSTSLDGIRSVSADDDHLFLVQETAPKISITNLTGSSVETLILNDFGNSFFSANVSGNRLGLIPNISGNVDVIDMESLERVDTERRDRPDYINPEFFDVGAVSKPQLISVSVTPNVSQGEVWQMIFSESTGTYQVTGSKSGLQNNEVTPGITYTSDNGEISLLTRPSFLYPETTGDYFSFLTLDPIEPILINSQSLAIAGFAFNRISDGKAIAYIIQQTNGQVSIVDLGSFKVKKTL